ncbi:MAG: phosphoribosylformylglycinamidine cyclo-ligase [bacterium JZ-2024 1]
MASSTPDPPRQRGGHGYRRAHKSRPLTYRAAGVDLDAPESALAHLLPVLNATIPNGALREGIGGFSALINLRAFSRIPSTTTVVSACTDGVGTKIELLRHTRRDYVAGIDAVAMCLNDLVTSGAHPAFFLDYFASSRFDPLVFNQILKGIADACKQCGCAVVGGETATLPGFFRGSLYDVVGFAVGFARESALFPAAPSLRAGDILIGIPSSGPHSNGFSLIRRVLKKRRISLQDTPSDFQRSLADLLLAPTFLYPPLIGELIRKHPRKILAAAHVTGGGIPGNLPRILPPHLSADLQIPSRLILPIFRWLQRNGNIPEDDLWNTFNMGIGFIIVVRPRQVDAFLADIRAFYPTAEVIGQLVPGTASVSIRVL